MTKAVLEDIQTAENPRNLANASPARKHLLDYLKKFGDGLFVVCEDCTKDELSSKDEVA
ncbi:MAG: hypothetical protein ACW99U_04920 [Candidatus Thorarchaeota archaeon]|jgi:hypothetical protein